MPIETRSIEDIVTFLVNFIRTNAEERLQADVDLTAGSPIHDLFILPQATQMSLVYDSIAALQILQSIDNATLMTESELDRLAANWFVTRNPATRARGQVLFFSAQKPTEDVVIPIGTTVTSESIAPEGSVTFVVTDGVVVPANDVPTFEIDGRTVFGVLANVKAELPGTEGNIPARSITRTSRGITIKSLPNVTNLEPFSGGTDAESNSEFAARIATVVQGRNIGSVDFLNSLVIDNFPDASQVLVVTGPPLMQRDFGLGGKVDIYIKGSRPLVDVVTIEVDEETFIFPQAPMINPDEIRVTLLREEFDEETGAILLVDDIELALNEDYAIEFDNGLLRKSVRDQSKIRWLRRSNNQLELLGQQVRIEYLFDGLINEIQQKIEEEKIVGLDVLVRRAVARPVTLSIDVDALMETESDRKVIAEDIRDNIVLAINALDIGEGIDTAKLIKIVMENPNVINVRLPFTRFSFVGDEVAMRPALEPAENQFLTTSSDFVEVNIADIKIAEQV